MDGAYISPAAKIGSNVTIMPGAYVSGECEIGDGSYIGCGVKLTGEIHIGKNVVIRENAVIGADGLSTDREEDGTPVTMPQFGCVVLEDDVQIGANAVVQRGAIDETSDSLALFGETGTVSLSGKILDEVQAWSFEKGPQSRDEAVDRFEVPRMGGGHTQLYGNVIDAIEHGGPLLCPPEDGRKALELVLAIYKSAYEHRQVKLPLKNCSCEDFIGMFYAEKVYTQNP